jgi:Xaa-Pro aminopeptidase
MKQNDSVSVRMPRSELERRWRAAREHMKDRQVDVLVVLGFDNPLSGYIRWFCDFGAPAYMKVALFFADGPMTIVEHGAVEGERSVSPDNPDTPGVDRILAASAFASVAATYDYEARSVVGELKRRNLRRVGLVRPGGMPHAFIKHLHEALADVVFSDETESLDRIKAIKSEAELQSLRKACWLQDEVFAKVLRSIKPGMREAELLSLAEHEFRLQGALDGTMASGSAPPGRAAALKPWRGQHRTLEQGDCFTVLLEMSNDAGYYGELARQIVIGKPTQEHVEAYCVIQEAQKAAVSRLKPGASCAALADAHDSFMTHSGFAPERRLFSHSQGYDLVERPLIRSDETMSVASNMFFSCHPAIGSPTLFAFQCDNYIVDEHAGAQRIHRTEQRIFEV